MKFEAGRKRSTAEEEKSLPAAAVTIGRGCQELSDALKNSQVPWDAVAALPTIATPASVFALDPPVTASVLSLKLLVNKELTVAPEIEPLRESSVTAANVALPVATGASFTGVTVRLMVSVATEYDVVPPRLTSALRSAVPPLLPEILSQALTFSAEAKVPFHWAVGRKCSRVSALAASNRAVLSAAVKVVQVVPPLIE